MVTPPGSVTCLACCLVLVVGCATDPAGCRAPLGDRGVTPARVASGMADPGERVSWGGTLVAARNLERSTELEMVGFPLDDCGRVRRGAGTVGRFIVVCPGYLETADLPPGTEITATGPIVGLREGRVGEAAYRFPLLRDPRPRVWRADGGAGYPSAGWPGISIGVGGGSGWRGGGIGIIF